MRKCLIILILLLLDSYVFAQTSKPWRFSLAEDRIWHFGYSVGTNLMGFYIPEHTYVVKLNRLPGININLIADYKIGKYWNIRFIPGIQLAQRDLNVNNHKNPYHIESIFLDLPFLLKYRSSRISNYAPYLIAGFNPRVDLGRRPLAYETLMLGPPMLKVFDIYPELGIGVDLYADDAKFGVELKFAIGLFNVFLSPIGGNKVYNLDDYRNGVSNMKSRMVILVVNIE